MQLLNKYLINHKNTNLSGNSEQKSKRMSRNSRNTGLTRTEAMEEIDSEEVRKLVMQAKMTTVIEELTERNVSLRASMRPQVLTWALAIEGLARQLRELMCGRTLESPITAKSLAIEG